MNGWRQSGNANVVSQIVGVGTPLSRWRLTLNGSVTVSESGTGTCVAEICYESAWSGGRHRTSWMSDGEATVVSAGGDPTAMVV